MPTKVKKTRIVVKAGGRGSIEALRPRMEQLSSEEVRSA